MLEVWNEIVVGLKLEYRKNPVPFLLVGWLLFFLLVAGVSL